MKKKIIKIKGDKQTIEYKECNPRQLPLSSKFIAPYWFDAIQNAFQYEKERGLINRHLLVSDNRIADGLKLYQDKQIVEQTITTVNGGDVLAYVLSKDKTKKYIVIIKNYLPLKLPQYNYERERFISNLQVSCTCTDSVMGRYRENSNLICKHTAAVIWFLIDKFDMPKIFIKPEERTVGWQKSKIVELETNIEALPLVKFRSYINILLLKKYRGVKPAMGLSIHTISNTDQKEHYQPKWLTFTNEAEVKKILKGTLKAYSEISKKEIETIFNEIGGDIIKTLKERMDGLEAEFKKEKEETNKDILTIAERVKEKQKETDSLIKRLLKITERETGMIEDLQKAVGLLTDKTDTTLTNHSNNYINLKDDLDKVKSNFWLTLFGVK